jgi:hypothetical protein
MSAVLLFAGLAFACWLMSGTVVPWDSKNHFYPMFRFLADALQHGEIPLWNPYHFAGHPAVADPQSLIFTPSMMLFAWVAPHASMQVFDGVIEAHLAFGALSVLGLFRRRHWHPAGAVLAAVIFMLGGSASSRLQHTGMIISYSFFPAAMWCLEIALERRSYRFAALFGVFTALMALGRDQVAFLLCVVLMARVAWAVWASGEPLPYLRARAGVLALAGLISGTALLVPVLLTMQFLGASNRPAIPFGVAVTGSLAPVNLITLVAPNFFGSLNQPYDYWGPGDQTLWQPDWTDRAINYLFIGTLPMLLIAWHGLAAGRLFERRARFFTVILGLALVYALGRFTPFFARVFDWMPGVSLYRRPADATFVLNIALAIGAGYLLHRFVEDGRPRPLRHLPKQLAFALAAVTTLGFGILIDRSLAYSFQEGHLAGSLRQLGLTALLIAGGTVLILAFESHKHRAFAAAAIAMLAGGEILWRNAASPLNAETVGHYSVYAQMTPSSEAGIEVLRREIAAKAHEGDHPRVEMLGLTGPWQNASMVLKLENTLGYNPLRIDDYERAVGPGENATDLSLRHYPGTFRGYKCHLASLLGLEYLVLDRPLSKLPRHVPRPGSATPIYASDTMYIYRLGSAAPRTYFATSVKVIDDDTVLDDQVLPDFDRTKEVLIDRSSVDDLNGEVLNRETGTPAEAKVSIVKYDDSAVTIDVDTDKAGVVVLHDLFYPGWEASVDGESEPVLRANILFRGVNVPAGHHRVEFEFHPLSFANLTAAASSLLHKNEE